MYGGYHRNIFVHSYGTGVMCATFFVPLVLSQHTANTAAVHWIGTGLEHWRIFALQFVRVRIKRTPCTTHRSGRGAERVDITAAPQLHKPSPHACVD